MTDNPASSTARRNAAFLARATEMHEEARRLTEDGNELHRRAQKLEREAFRLEEQARS